MRRWALALLLLAAPAWGGASRDFDGTNDKITFASFTPPTVSVSAWIDADTLTGNILRIVAKCDGAGSDVGNILLDTYDGSDNGGLRFVLQLGSGYEGVITAGTLSTGWINVIGTYDGSSIHLYKNGSEIGTPDVSLASSTLPSSTQPWTIGEDDPQGSDAEYFDGRIAYVAIWERGLTAAEISTLQTCTPDAVAAGLVLYPELRSSGGAYADLSGNGRTGTNSGTTESSDGPPVMHCGGGPL